MAEEGGASGGSEILDCAMRGDTAALAAALGRAADSTGADLNAADRWGVTALAHAAQKGDLESVQLLLQKGASVDQASRFGNTALMAAAARGRDAVVSALLGAGADPTARNKWGLDAADWARWPENAGDVLALLQQDRDSGSR